jgi:tRNA threonylcarbamoyladenosine biosynthesis protein TsaB
MKLLAIETSTKSLSLALADGQSILSEYKGGAALRHSQDLVPNLEALLQKAEMTLDAIDCFAISAGPGSFTGLRVGIAMAKGLNFATRIPIVAVPTLDAIASNLGDSGNGICVVVDARKKNLYASLYKADKGGIIRVSGYELVAAEELKERLKAQEKTLFTGDGIAPYREIIKEQFKGARFADERHWYPDVKVIARLGAEKFKNREFSDPDALVPMYIYSRECNVKGVFR